jgi:hypothetical protein
MLPFRKILYPVDFSEANIAMAPFVTEMAQRFDATVTVLNVFYLIHEYSLAPSLDNRMSGPIAIPYTPDFQELRNERERLLEEFSRTHFASLKRTTRLEDGEGPRKVPPDAIGLSYSKSASRRWLPRIHERSPTRSGVRVATRLPVNCVRCRIEPRGRRNPESCGLSRPGIRSQNMLAEYRAIAPWT